MAIGDEELDGNDIVGDNSSTDDGENKQTNYLQCLLFLSLLPHQYRPF